MSDSELVYSTDKGRIKPQKAPAQITESDGFARVRRETKGRKGKGVMVISTLGLDTAGLKKLAKELKQTCGCGGSVVNDTIEVQSDNREKIKAVLEKHQYKVKFIGG